MWISNKIAAAPEARRGAELARVTIGGEGAAADGAGESRELCITAPYGICALPAAGAEALIIECGDGERVLAGCAQTPAAGMSPGELRLYSGSTVIYLRQSGVEVTGNVRIAGDLAIAGTVSVTGGMTLNGLPVAVVSPV